MEEGKSSLVREGFSWAAAARCRLTKTTGIGLASWDSGDSSTRSTVQSMTSDSDSDRPRSPPPSILADRRDEDTDGTTETEAKFYRFPSLYLMPGSTLCLPMRSSCSVQIAVDGGIRMVWGGVASIMVGNHGSIVALNHPLIRLVRYRHFAHAQIGTVPLPANQVEWCQMGAQLVGDSELTDWFFRNLTFQGIAARGYLRGLVEKAHFWTNESGTDILHLPGLLIRQDSEGTLTVRGKSDGLSCRLDILKGKVRLNLADDLRISACEKGGVSVSQPKVGIRVTGRRGWLNVRHSMVQAALGPNALLRYANRLD